MDNISSDVLSTTNCRTCKWVEGTCTPNGGIIELGDYWTLNHYGGQEGFLGWLAISPKRHIMDSLQFEPEEAQAFYPCVLDVERAMREEFSQTFCDPIMRMYVLYFHEGVFDRTPHLYHLHFHLIPRLNSFSALMQLEDGSGINAWNIPRLNRDIEAIPPLREKYRRTADNVKRLMDSLRSRLGGS